LEIKLGKIIADAPALADIECFVLDMDGTINLGHTLIDGAMEFVTLLQQRKIPFYFFTNNSSKAPSDYVEKLLNLGFPDITRDHIMTAGDVMVHYLNTHCKNKPRIYLAGTPELENQFCGAGIELTDGTDETVDFAVLGFDTTFDFHKADTLCKLITAGVPFVATNIDRVCPLEGGAFLPDCGSMSCMIAHATGVEPKFVGKPFVETVEFIAAKTGIGSRHTAMVGDRLYTDIKTAVAGGMTGIAVLSGEISFDDVVNGDVVPDYLLNSVRDIYAALV